MEDDFYTWICTAFCTCLINEGQWIVNFINQSKKKKQLGYRSKLIKILDKDKTKQNRKVHLIWCFRTCFPFDAHFRKIKWITALVWREKRTWRRKAKSEHEVQTLLWAGQSLNMELSTLWSKQVFQHLSGWSHATSILFEIQDNNVQYRNIWWWNRPIDAKRATQRKSL